MLLFACSRHILLSQCYHTIFVFSLFTLNHGELHLNFTQTCNRHGIYKLKKKKKKSIFHTQWQFNMLYQDMIKSTKNTQKSFLIMFKVHILFIKICTFNNEKLINEVIVFGNSTTSTNKLHVATVTVLHSLCVT